jgi:hypothetical protein
MREPFRSQKPVLLLSDLEPKLGGRKVIHTVQVNVTIDS